MRSRKRIIECEEDLFSDLIKKPEMMSFKRRQYCSFDEEKDYDIIKVQKEIQDEAIFIQHSENMIMTAFKKKGKGLGLDSLLRN